MNQYGLAAAQLGCDGGGGGGGGEHGTGDTDGWQLTNKFWPHVDWGGGDGYEYDDGGDGATGAGATKKFGPNKTKSTVSMRECFRYIKVKLNEFYQNMVLVVLVPGMKVLRTEVPNDSHVNDSLRKMKMNIKSYKQFQMKKFNKRIYQNYKLNGILEAYLKIERNRRKMLHIIVVKCSICTLKSILILCVNNYMNRSLVLLKHRLDVVVDCMVLKY